MKTDLYNQEGEKIGEIDLPDRIFNIKINPDLLHQAIRYYQFLSRQPIVKTKTRSEVRGGGRKPWRQKGTGRARHGSIRSPIWKGGGVTFGPSPEKKYQIKLPKKMRKKALYMVLSGKAKEGEIVILDKLNPKTAKTKEGVRLLENLSKIKKDIKDKKTVFALVHANEKFLKSISNLKNVSTIPLNSLNAYFLLKNKYLVMEKEGIRFI